MFTAVFVAALLQSAAINLKRDNYMSCLDKAFAAAKEQKLPAEALDASLRSSCTAAEEPFKASLIAFDLKNKVARKQAAADAQLQVDDFVTSLVERYRAMAARK